MTPSSSLEPGMPTIVGEYSILPVVRTVTWTSETGGGGHVEVAGLFILVGDETYAALLSDAVTMTDLIQAVRS